MDIHNVHRMPNLYSMVEPIPGALEGIQELRRRGHRVVFVTAAVVGSMDQKARWLKRHGFLTDLNDLIVAQDKSLVQGQVLIDGGPHKIEAFPRYAPLYPAPPTARARWP